MKIAIAQVDMRLGDIDAICGRLESQAVIAHEQGARLLCAPAPLLTGTMPGMLMASRGFMHDMLSGLSALSERVALLDIALLVPAIVEYQGTALFETFLLRKGRVVPIRALAALRGERAGEDLWLPPVFEVDGLRCAPVFDFERDIDLVPIGCDVVIYFQAAPFCAARAESAAVASVADGHFRPQIAQRSMWLACVAPVGGFDEAAFSGGSFFMDDCGRVIAAAPCFEEALLVQDVQRGITVPCIEDHLLPHFDRSEWLWEALRLWLADAAGARGLGGAAVVLAGDLPSSLAAALCVDAFGSRNVVGIVIERARALTPQDEEAERERLDRARAVASGLRIRTVERVEPAFSELLDRDAPPAGIVGEGGRRGASARAADAFEQMVLADIAERERALPVRSLCKTDYALAPDACAAGPVGAVAPFGDVYLTALEFLARWRNGSGSTLPAPLATLRAVRAALAGILARASLPARIAPEFGARAAELLRRLGPAEVDGVLEAHIDRALPFDEIPLAAQRPDAVAVLLMLVRHGEAARRALPAYPSVSACSLAERAWPASLAWSELGLRGAEPQTLEALVRAELERAESRGAEMGERMRDELVGFVSNLLGITPEQLEELGSEEGRARLGASLPQVEEQIQRSLQQLFEQGGAGGRLGGPHGLPFFSRN